MPDSPSEARPRTPDEVAGLLPCPEIVRVAQERGISDVVHFTTVRGALGVLASHAVMSRRRLPEEQYLEHVYRPNSDIRKDQAWLDYVNLSISRINDWMFENSVRWHIKDDNPWVVLAFDPVLLGDPGVVFATTNNIYPACRRAEGLGGFQNLFADSVIGRTYPVTVRHDRTGKPANWPTDRQAGSALSGRGSLRVPASHRRAAGGYDRHDAWHLWGSRLERARSPRPGGFRMNEPDLFPEEAKTANENPARPRGKSSDQVGLEVRVARSALWAAYGDALGWISELTDAAGLKRRTQGAPLDRPIAWKRRIGGRSGVTVTLPRGCYSDDTQLRLATGRAIRSDGFDIEAFAKVELPLWLSYGLGGGKSTSAAAAQLGRKNPAWWSNKFKGWTNSGGNGAAMRVQPHVWAARVPADPESYLPDVVRNSVCTHSHPTGLAGAVFHALCVAHAMCVGDLPSPDELREVIRAADGLPEIIARDTELGYWRIAVEQEVGNFEESWTKAMNEVREAIALTATCVSGTRGNDGYDAISNTLKLRDPARRGSGMLTAVAALGLAWCEARPTEAMRIAANAIGTDTDTIATMAGAILGATTDIDLPVDVLDDSMICSEAKRLARIAAGESPRNHEYPDLLHWSAPKARADALARTRDSGLMVRGLGRARSLEGEPVLASGEFQWQWVKLEFGQTLLIKSRTRLPDIEEVREPVEPRVSAVANEQRTSPPVAQQQRPRFDPTGRKPPGEHDLPRVRTDTHDIRDVVAYVEKHIDDDQIVGRALRRVVRKGTTGQVAAFNAALIDLLRSHADSSESG